MHQSAVINVHLQVQGKVGPFKKMTWNVLIW